MVYWITKDNANQWRWRLVAPNGKIIAVSSESYWHKADCLHAIDLVKSSSNAPVYEH